MLTYIALRELSVRIFAPRPATTVDCQHQFIRQQLCLCSKPVIATENAPPATTSVTFGNDLVIFRRQTMKMLFTRNRIALRSRHQPETPQFAPVISVQWFCRLDQTHLQNPTSICRDQLRATAIRDAKPARIHKLLLHASTTNTAYLLVAERELCHKLLSAL
jgi:hypothetical protein